MKNTLLVVFALLVAVNLSSQTNFYVSKGGDDAGTGSASDPWETIQFAMDHAQPGSTVFIGTGTYHEKVYLNVSGNENGWIVFKNKDNEEVIVDGSGLSDPAICEIYDQQYVRIEGIHFTNNIQNDAMGIFIEGNCHSIEVINCKISNIHFSDQPNDPVNENTNSQPFIVYGVNDNPITGLLVKGCEIFNCRTGYSEALAVNGNVDGFEISNNHVHDITNIGIDLIGHEGTCSNPAFDQARNGLIKWNQVYHCLSPYASAAGIYVDGAKDLVIENNRVYENQWGIEVGCENPGKTSSGVVVRNNLIYGNSSAGIQLGGYDYPDGSGKVTDSKIINNTCLNNAVVNNYDGELTLTYSENCEIVNNIFYALNPEGQLMALEDVASVPPGLVMDYNLWFHPQGENAIYIYWNGADFESFSDFKNSTGLENHALFTDPDFVSTADGNLDLHIKFDSKARDAADQSYAAFAGTVDMDNEARINQSLDLGADEYYSSTGIDDMPEQLDFLVYPNPASEYIYLECPAELSVKYTELFDMQGRSMLQVDADAEKVIPLAGLEPGLYFVKVSGENHYGIQKILIQR